MKINGNEVKFGLSPDNHKDWIYLEFNHLPFLTFYAIKNVERYNSFCGEDYAFWQYMASGIVKQQCKIIGVDLI